MNLKLPIVIAGYNRPESLKRLLGSIGSAFYPVKSNIDLVISIDYWESNECIAIAEEFAWSFGTKTIIAHNENLGLRKHILVCGDIALDNDGVIILEDDCFVSKDFYNYALQSFKFYKDENKIAGISLYSYQFNENAGMPFTALSDGFDVYFMKIPSSWGQIWSKGQWQSFKLFYNSFPILNEEKDKLPKNIFTWPESSWKKYFYKYMVEKDLYFVYPQIAHSTNFGDIGTHYSDTTQLLQVNLNTAINQQYNLISIEKSWNIYDAYFEIHPIILKVSGLSAIYKELTIDTYGTKQPELISTPYVLTLQSHPNAMYSYGIVMKPLINNIVYNNIGDGLSVIKKTDLFPLTNKSSELIKQHYQVAFSMGHTLGYTFGKNEILNSKTYKLGYYLKKIISPKLWKL